MRKCQRSTSKPSGAFETAVNYPFINPNWLFHDAVAVSSIEDVILLRVLFKGNVCVAFCLSNATLTDGGEVGGGRRVGGLILSLRISEGRLLLMGLKCLGVGGHWGFTFFVCGKKIHLKPRRIPSYWPNCSEILRLIPMLTDFQFCQSGICLLSS